MMQLLVVMSDSLAVENSQWIDWLSVSELLIRFLLNITILFLTVRWLYYSSAQRKDYLFTFFTIGTIVFLLCFLLGNLKVTMGFALGLFAIFGIIRYRTDQVPIKEMTYLFLVVAISAINAMGNIRTNWVEMLFSNLAVFLIIFGFEKLWLLKHESVKDIIYERIELIKPERYYDLLLDLRNRTGIRTISRVEVGRIDFLHDTCQLKIYYQESGSHINMADNQHDSSGDDD